MIEWLLVFVAFLVMDMAYAAWAKKVAERDPLQASLYAVAIVLCSAFVTISFVKDYWTVVPAALGAFVGTWIVVRRP
mgnify:CR=1 FL=1